MIVVILVVPRGSALHFVDPLSGRTAPGGTCPVTGFPLRLLEPFFTDLTMASCMDPPQPASSPAPRPGFFTGQHRMVTGTVRDPSPLPRVLPRGPPYTVSGHSTGGPI